MTLRTRLTLTVVLTVLVAGVAVAAAGSWATRRELYHQAAQTLEGEATRLADRPPFARVRLIEAYSRPDVPPVQGPGLPPRRGGGPPVLPQDRSIQDLDRGGRVVAAAGPFTIPVSRTDARIAADGGRATRSVQVDGTDLLVVTMGARGGGAVQFARDLSETDATIARLRTIAILIGVAGVALAAVVGLLITRRALRPVEALTDDVERRAAEPDDLTPLGIPARTDEVGRLATAYDALLAALAASREQQRALVADASHELRTPITSLRAAIELLDRAPDLPEATRRELLANSVAEVEELTHLVDEVVDLAAGSSTDSPLEPCHLDELVANVVSRARRRTEAPVLLDAAPCTVMGRAPRIERAVGNLVDNARKWSPPGATIEVRVVDGRVSVRDHGPGVPPEERERVFARFARGAAVEGVPGSGLGLAIVADVAREHRGRAWIEGPEGGGALAVLEFPTVAER